MIRSSTSPARPASPSAKLLYSIRELVDLTGLSRATLYREMADGRLAYIQVRRRRRVRHDALIAWLDAPLQETMKVTAR